MTQSQEQYEQLTAYLDGELTESQAKDVEQLLARNADARRLLAELRATSRLVASLPKAPAPPGLAAAVTGRLERQALFGESATGERYRSGRRWLVRTLAVAAVLMLMLTAGWFFLPDLRIGEDQRNVLTVADNEAPARKSLAAKGSPAASLQGSHQTAAQPRGEKVGAAATPPARQRAAKSEGETVAAQADRKTKGPNRTVAARPSADEAEVVAQPPSPPTAAVLQEPIPGEQKAVRLPESLTAAAMQEPGLEEHAAVQLPQPATTVGAEPTGPAADAVVQGQKTQADAQPDAGGRGAYKDRGRETGDGVRHGEKGRGTGGGRQPDGRGLDAAGRDWPTGRGRALDLVTKGGTPSEGGPASFDELLAGNVLTNDDLRRMTVTCAARQVVAVSDAQAARRLRRHTLDFLKSHGVMDARRQALPEPIASSQSFYLLSENDGTTAAVEDVRILANLPERAAFELVESLRQIASDDPASISLIAEEGEPFGARDELVREKRRLPSAAETPETPAERRDESAVEALAAQRMITLGIDLLIRSEQPTRRPARGTQEKQDAQEKREDQEERAPLSQPSPRSIDGRPTDGSISTSQPSSPTSQGASGG